MAHSLSAKKRVRQNVKRRALNRVRKSQVKRQIKDLGQALSSGDLEAASEQYRLVVKKLDKTSGTSTMHKRTAARKKSRLARQLNSLRGKGG